MISYDDLTASNASYLVYDGDCPLCSQYTKYVLFKEAIGQVTLVNCREHKPLLAELKHNGYNMNDGMLFAYQGEIFWGDQAIFTVAALSTPHNTFNRINALLFKKAAVVKLLYPAMVFGRKILLKMLNKTEL